MTKGYNI